MFEGSKGNAYVEVEGHGRMTLNGTCALAVRDDHLYDAKNVDYPPYVDLKELVGASKSGNICFDDDGNLYVCSGQSVLPDTKLRGVMATPCSGT